MTNEKAKKALKIAGKVFTTVLTVILVLVITFNLLNLFLRKSSNSLQPNLFGYSTAVVISGSMEPTINVNDLVFYKVQENYEVGDVVIFANPGGKSCTTHRIVGVAEDGFITKGDANNTEDMFHTRKEDIFGAYLFSIPGVGLISEYMMKPIGIFILFVLGAIVLVLPTLMARKTEEEEKKQPSRSDELQAEIDRLKAQQEEKKD